jgi:hypothetical protein
MRCDNCNKFASLESPEEAEEQSTDFDSTTGQWNAEYRIVRNCADCGQEMKEATFSFEDQLDDEMVEEHQDEGHELTANFTAEVLEEGGGRYKKSYYGVSLMVGITCSCGKLTDSAPEDEAGVFFHKARMQQ